MKNIQDHPHTIAVLAASAALTLTGVGPAPAQSSSVDGLESPPSWIGEPESHRAERQLRHAGTHHRFHQAEAKQYRSMVNDFRNSDELHGFHNGHYGVHTAVRGNHVYITTAFPH